MDYSREIELLNQETGKGSIVKQESVEKLKALLERRQARIDWKQSLRTDEIHASNNETNELENYNHQVNKILIRFLAR